jgi:uncharacterized repeat protein (TIGR01451 family)
MRQFLTGQSSSTCTKGPRPTGRNSGATRVSSWLLGAALLAIAVFFGFAPARSLAANPAANIDQCANGSDVATASSGCNTAAADWVNGNLGSSKSAYREGDTIPYRITLSNLAVGSPHALTIEWDTTKSGKHAIDYIDTFNQSVLDANPCLGVSGCNSGSFTTGAIPVDPQVSGGGVTPIAGSFRLYGGNITSLTRPSSVGSTTCTAANSSGSYCYSTGTGFGGDKSAAITINFTASVSDPVLAWGGHIATPKDWGNGNSAVSISGSPYHSRLVDLDGSGGNQDRSLSAAAVIFPGFIHIIKNATGGDNTFPFSASPLPLSNFNLTTVNGTGEQDFNGITSFQTYTVAEGANPTNWTFDSASCAVAAGTDNGGSQSVSAKTATINLAEGEEVTCTYANHFVAAPALTVVKSSTDTTFSNVGDVLHYSYLVTNTGNQALSGISVTDNNIDTPPGVDCSGQTTLAVGAHMTCTATHTVTQADLDACVVKNTVTVTSTQGAGDTDDLTINGTCTKALSITKVATESGFSKVGDVIHYTIVATNSGNVTLHNVVVTDSEVSNLSCDTTMPADLAPGASINCTASHTITQADIDAGSFYNQACVDDGSGGATQKCADVTTPGTLNPHLAITKTDNLNPAKYDHVGQVITYTITATNDGNVTLHNVTVTDTPSLTGFSCTPAIPVANLAPGASITCTGTHSITAGDLSSGSFVDNACADDGAGGAAQACASDTITGAPPTIVSQITPTQTTCSQFASGTSPTLSSIFYSVKSGKVGQNVNPGVMFYWVKVTAAAGSNTFTVTQTRSETSNAFTVASGSQAYTSGCGAVSTTITQAGNGTVTVKFNAASAGTYYIGVKYNPKAVSGEPVPSPSSTVSYTFATNGVAGSTSMVNLVKQ